MKIYDISAPLHNAMPVYPGDPPVIIEPALSVDKGNAANVSRLSMSTHSGTHIDAPRHIDSRGVSVDHLCLSVLSGRALVIEIGGTKKIGRKELERFPVKGEERLLLKTENSLLWSSSGFTEDFAHLTDDGADYLAGIGIKLIGIDYLSIEAFDGDGTVHRKLLEHGVIILEGLDLDGIKGGVYELICLPLKVLEGDGAPARAILRERDESSAKSGIDPHTTKWPLA
ncbi:MAG TPA: cyclase family protein [Geobacteraceae bacterium]|nr:cyclase family protein [Geobacteraceae bacterium]